MRLIIGLGNPGPEYERTRHNVGFGVVSELAHRHGIVLGRARHRARFGVGAIHGAAVLLAQPQTFMNASGAATRSLMAYQAIEPADLVVVHDDADFPTGVVRFKQGGGTAGHQGLASIVAQLGTADFLRVRVGIGRPLAPAADGLVDFVLGRPDAGEAERLARGIERGADAVEWLLRDGLEAAMREIHRPL